MRESSHVSHSRALTTLIVMIALGSSEGFQQSASVGAKGTSLQHLVDPYPSRGQRIHHQSNVASRPSRRQLSRKTRSRHGQHDTMQRNDASPWTLQARGGVGDVGGDPQGKAMDMSRRIQRLMDRSNSLTERIASSPNSLSFVWMEDQLRSLTAHLQKRKNAVVLDSNNAAKSVADLEWMEQELNLAAQQLDEFRNIVVESLSPEARDNEHELRKEMEEISQMSVQLEQFLKQSSSSTSKKKSRGQVFADEASKQEMLNAYERAKTSISRLDHIRKELAAVEEALDGMEHQQGVALADSELDKDEEDGDFLGGELPLWPPSQHDMRDPLKPQSLTTPSTDERRSESRGGSIDHHEQSGNFVYNGWYDPSTWPNNEPHGPKMSGTKSQLDNAVEEITHWPASRPASFTPHDDAADENSDYVPEPQKNANVENIDHSSPGDTPVSREEDRLLVKASASSQSNQQFTSKQTTGEQKKVVDIAQSSAPEIQALGKEAREEKNRRASATSSVVESSKPKETIHTKTKGSKQKMNFSGGGMDWGKLFDTLTNLGNANLSPSSVKKNKTTAKHPSREAKPNSEKSSRSASRKLNPMDLPPPRNDPVASESSKQRVPQNSSNMVSYGADLKRPAQWAEVQAWVHKDPHGEHVSVPANWAKMLQYDPDVSDGNSKEVSSQTTKDGRRPKKWAQVSGYIEEQKQHQPVESGLPRQWALMKKHVEQVSIPNTSGIPKRWAEMKHWTAYTKTTADSPASLEVSRQTELPDVYETIMSWASRQKVVPSPNKVLYLLRNQKVAAAAKEGESRWGSLENAKASAITMALQDASALELPEVGQAMPITLFDEEEEPPSLYEQRNERVAISEAAGKTRWGALETRKARSATGGTVFAEPVNSLPVSRSSPFSIGQLAKKWAVNNAGAGGSIDTSLQLTFGKQNRQRHHDRAKTTPMGALAKEWADNLRQSDSARAENDSGGLSRGATSVDVSELYQQRTKKVAAMDESSRWGEMEREKARQQSQSADNPAFPASVLTGRPGSPSPNDLFNKRIMKVASMADAGKSRWGEMENLRARQMRNLLNTDSDSSDGMKGRKSEEVVSQADRQNAPADDEKSLLGGLLDLFQGRAQKVAAMADAGKSRWGAMENLKAQRTTDVLWGLSGSDDSTKVTQAREQPSFDRDGSFSPTDLFKQRTMKVSAMADAGEKSRWGDMENQKAHQIADMLGLSQDVPSVPMETTKYSTTMDTLTQEWFSSNHDGEDPATSDDTPPENDLSEVAHEQSQGTSENRGESRFGAMENHRAQKMSNAFGAKSPASTSSRPSAASRGSPGFFNENNLRRRVADNPARGSPGGFKESTTNVQHRKDAGNPVNHRINWGELSEEAPTAASEERARKTPSMESRKPANAFEQSRRWNPFEFGEAPERSLGDKPEWPRVRRQEQTNSAFQMGDSSDLSVGQDSQQSVPNQEWPRVHNSVFQMGDPSDSNDISFDQDSLQSEPNQEWPRGHNSAFKMGDPSDSNDISMDQDSLQSEPNQEWPRVHNSAFQMGDPSDSNDISFDQVSQQSGPNQEWPRVHNSAFQMGDSIDSNDISMDQDSLQSEPNQEWPRVHNSAFQMGDSSDSNDISMDQDSLQSEPNQEWPRVHNSAFQMGDSSDSNDISMDQDSLQSEPNQEWPRVHNSAFKMGDPSDSNDISFDQVSQQSGPNQEWPRVHNSAFQVGDSSDSNKASFDQDLAGEVSHSELQWRPFNFGEVEQARLDTEDASSDLGAEVEGHEHETFGWPRVPVDAFEEQGPEEGSAGPSELGELATETSDSGIAGDNPALSQVELSSEPVFNDKVVEHGPDLLPTPAEANDDGTTGAATQQILQKSATLAAGGQLKENNLYRARTKKIAAMADASRWGSMEINKAQQLTSSDDSSATAASSAVQIDENEEGVKGIESSYGLYLERAAGVAEAAKAGKSRWGSLENWKAQVMVDSVTSRSMQGPEQDEGSGVRASMDKLATEWTEMNKEQPAPLPERTKDPSSALYEKRAFKIVAAAEAGESRWGSMENWKAQLIVDAASRSDLEGSGQSSWLESREGDSWPDSEITSDVPEMQTNPDVSEPTKLYEDRAVKVSAAASAGKSRWGMMENSRAQAMVDANSPSITGSRVSAELPSTSSSMAQLAAQWASALPLDSSDSARPLENEEDQPQTMSATQPASEPTIDDVASAPETKPSLLDGLASLFQQRNEKVAVMADAGKSRWGSMENLKAQGMVDSSGEGYHVRGGITSKPSDVLPEGVAQVDNEEKELSKCDGEGVDGGETPDPDEPSATLLPWKPKRRSWTGSMNEWAKAWSDMRSFRTSAAVDHLANDWSSDKPDPEKSEKTPAQRPMPSQDSDSAEKPPVFSMTDLATQWASINTDHSGGKKTQNGPLFPSVVAPKPDVLPKENEQAQVRSVDTEAMEQLSREWRAANKDNKEDEAPPTPPAVVDQGVPQVQRSKQESAPDLIPDEMPNSYQTVMEWAAAEKTPPTVANVIFQLRNFNVANSAANGKSRWGTAENLRSISMVKSVISSLSNAAEGTKEQTDETPLLDTDPKTGNSAHMQLVEDDTPTQNSIPGSTESMDALTESWEEDWTAMNQDGSLYVDEATDPSTSSMDALTESWAEDWAALNKGDGTAEPDNSANLLAPTERVNPDAAISAIETLGLASNDPVTKTKQGPSISDWRKLLQDWSRVNSDKD